MAIKKKDPDTVFGYPRDLLMNPNFWEIPDATIVERNLRIEAKNSIKQYSNMLISQEITCDRWFRLVRDCLDATYSNIAAERGGGFDAESEAATAMKEKQLDALIRLSQVAETITHETSIEEKRAFKNAACRLADI